MQKSPATAAALMLAIFVPGPASAQSDVDQQLGNVSFEVSCNETAQRRFNRAMRYQHSFWYGAAKEIFEGVADSDPTCAMAHWGVALALLNNPHAAIPAPNLAPGLAAIQRARSIGAKTERERDYIEALALMYVGYDKLTHAQRIGSFRDAMEKLAAKYPNDDEAQIAYAITLNTSASPADKTYAQQSKGAAILEPLSKRLPLHPGVTHYLIHLYDYPATAQQGLDAANRYAKIAPAAPHAQHMPSHIYTRVGFWRESVASNIASVKAAQADKSLSDQLHGQDYMVYAYLQLAQDKAARAVVDEMLVVTGYNPSLRAATFAVTASPARYMMERGDWKGASELQVRPTGTAYIDAITHFARAVGAARAGKPEAAKVEIDKLVELRDQTREAKDAYWTEQVDIQLQVANAWLLYTQGRREEALQAMSTAADAEDKTEKSPVTPGPLAPARELYGEMLLEHGAFKEALAAFEATKSKEPNRFRGFLGAAKAAEKLGDKTAAKENYQKIVQLVGNGKSDRPEVDAALQYLQQN